MSRIGDSASVQGVTRVNAEQASKRTMRRPTRRPFRGRLTRLGYRAKPYAQTLPSRWTCESRGRGHTLCPQPSEPQHRPRIWPQHPNIRTDSDRAGFLSYGPQADFRQASHYGTPISSSARPQLIMPPMFIGDDRGLIDEADGLGLADGRVRSKQPLRCISHIAVEPTQIVCRR